MHQAFNFSYLESSSSEQMEFEVEFVFKWEFMYIVSLIFISEWRDS